MTQRYLHAYVTGKVQGVGYRQATQAQASSLNVTGFAKNLPDGRVEVAMYGEEQDVEALGQWLWQGPKAAHVSQVNIEDDRAVEDGTQAPSGFATC